MIVMLCLSVTGHSIEGSGNSIRTLMIYLLKEPEISQATSINGI